MTTLSKYIFWCGAPALLALSGCKKYLQVPLPVNSIAAQSAFGTDAASASSLNGIYSGLLSDGVFDGNGSVGYLTGMYTDELKNYFILPTVQALYADQVSTSLGGVTILWSTLYQQLYAINQAIEYIPQSSGLQHKDQWLGEAYFLRGLCYFYLTNLYGDVPLVVSTDYLANNALARAPQAGVYAQVVSDLRQAQGLLTDAYYDGNGNSTADRGRPNRMAATALLSRVYLYTAQWASAETQADSVLADAADYSLEPPADVFLVSSKEIIWGMEPIQTNTGPYIDWDVLYYTLTPGTDPLASSAGVSLSDSLVNAFEPGDARFTHWVGVDSVPSAGRVYYYAAKYKDYSQTLTAPTESVVLLRLGEEYLIRAEARARQNNLSGAAADLNAVRARANLAPVTATAQPAMLAAILHERRIELFLENGHRFLDLRRTGNLDAVMTPTATAKGGSWSSFMEWWPIPVGDLQNDTHLTQTPGYQ